jgi:hypothetical protein
MLLKALTRIIREASCMGPRRGAWGNDRWAFAWPSLKFGAITFIQDLPRAVEQATLTEIGHELP